MCLYVSVCVFVYLFRVVVLVCCLGVTERTLAEPQVIYMYSGVCSFIMLGV